MWCIYTLITQTTIGSDNGLSPGRRQAIIWTNAGILIIEPLGTNFNEILIKIHAFSFTKIHLKMLSGKWRPFCLSLNVIRMFACALLQSDTLGCLIKAHNPNISHSACDLHTALTLILNPYNNFCKIFTSKIRPIPCPCGRATGWLLWV